MTYLQASLEKVNLPAPVLIFLNDLGAEPITWGVNIDTMGYSRGRRGQNSSTGADIDFC